MNIDARMAATEKNVGNLEQEALKRRERLQNLKRKREGKTGENEEVDSLPKPIFRSYKPMNEELNEFTLDPSTPGDVTSEVKYIYL